VVCIINNIIIIIIIVIKRSVDFRFVNRFLFTDRRLADIPRNSIDYSSDRARQYYNIIILRGTKMIIIIIISSDTCDAVCFVFIWIFESYNNNNYNITLNVWIVYIIISYYFVCVQAAAAAECMRVTYARNESHRDAQVDIYYYYHYYYYYAHSTLHIIISENYRPPPFSKPNDHVL